MTQVILGDRWASARPFVAIGSLCIVAGGLVAAATAPAASEHGSWSAAYLVLVAGVAQVGLGLGQALLRTPRHRSGGLLGELLTWNLGNAAVLVGAVLGTPSLADAGGGLLVVALTLFLAASRPARAGWLQHAYRLLILAVLVSIPVGLLLERLRPGG